MTQFQHHFLSNVRSDMMKEGPGGAMCPTTSKLSMPDNFAEISGGTTLHWHTVLDYGL